ncbi:flagellar export chaperone FliS [Lederbergia panacisoli]|uniref:flagellar export chaperone FliS n=1 Tax=Lederbergia panacisoli TaxID=1255251 RepID=UPI00214B8A2A|nr:flagellar export chaperone FliS [Lederbergia panacisoli]MCR2822355.1 flagellar export chaperone FliS [Lederbergia panacisoli]
MEFLTKELLYQQTPQQLTAFLYEACIDNLKEAITSIEKGSYTVANSQLQKVNDILERLGVGLNYESGIIADQLDTLYNYMANQVIIGNLNKDVPILQEVLNMLEQLASAWNEAMNMENTSGQRELHRKTSAYEKNVMVEKRDY